MHILFMCVANSARSQMAEGLARHIFGNQANFYSAGSNPSFVSPLSIKVLQELDIDISDHESKSVDQLKDVNFDYVITLCAEEVCPVYLGNTKKIHWPFHDPASQDESKALNQFRKIRDQIEAKLRSDLANLLLQSS